MKKFVEDGKRIRFLVEEKRFGGAPGGGDGEALAELAVAERVKVSPAAVFHHDARVVWRSIEVGVESREEGVIEDPEDPLLRHRSIELLLLRQRQLVDHLHRVRVRRSLVAQAAEIDSSDVAAANAAEELEVPGAEIGGKGPGTNRGPGRVR